MILAVASGKGGTGKTSVACALAIALDRPMTFLDCDVEGANAHLFLRPAMHSREEVFVPCPMIDADRCDACGRCVKECQFGAMIQLGKKVKLMANLCHGCGVCRLVCPRTAITMTGRPVGIMHSGTAGPIRFYCGELRTGEALSVPIIRKIKEQRGDLVIIDCPPGTSCPAVESVEGSDFALLVTEPTPFGEHDLRGMITVCRRLGVPCGVVINRSSGDDAIIESLCGAEGVSILMRIPFDRKVAEAYAKGGTLLEAMPGIKDQLLDMFLDIERLCR
ncbi:MAG: ATP-binding protein [Euryarchaeota archaeon]|jgi:MinD superfamily P-loop ATPase|nr:ATP-binding protein [Euryarchaeota archaeon]